jgi:DNA-directed RNA polymerase subunit B'
LKEKEKKEEKRKVTVYMNGKLIGTHDDGDFLVNELIKLRRSGKVSHELNIEYLREFGEVYINIDGGRSRRPLIVVENGRSKFTPEVIEKIKKMEYSWKDLIENGIVEYLDPGEEDTLAYIARNESEINERTTHLEMDPVGILSAVIAQIPMQEHNLSVRGTMAASMFKQSIGIYRANYNLAFDTRSYILYYPQEPIVRSKVSDFLGVNKRVGGENLVVALVSYEGYNMLDAIVMNRAAIERGMMRTVMFRTYETEERRYPGGQKDKFEIPQPTVSGYRGEEAYKYLDEDGIISPNVPVKGRDVLVGKTSPLRFLEEVSFIGPIEEKRRENSLALKAEEEGVVDKVSLTQLPSGDKLVKIRIRDVRIPENGDKFSSRHGQKGVIALIEDQEDMPFTESGLVPDLLLNPHAIPSRMTMGHVIEMLCGKAACMTGEIVDGTPFSENKEKAAREILKMFGFKESGHEIMYDGKTGKKFEVEIFIGVCYYQRLHHLVANKLHVRSKGPVQLLTHQPTEGRVREGGLRFGEMERDCLIGHGASMLLKERLIDESDRTIELVCAECGSIAVRDYAKNKDYCPLCGSSNVHPVEMSYAFKLLVYEIMALGVFPRLVLGDRSEITR